VFVKNLTAILLVFVMMISSVGKLCIIISFKINQDYIAKTQCEQRNIKNNKCRGCCQLKKEIAESDKQEQKQMPRGTNEKSSISIDYFCRELSNLEYLFNEQKLNFNIYSAFLPETFTGPVFRPPKG